MEPNTQPRSYAKDVFLSIASIITLYISVGSLLNLLFTVINKAYPRINGYYYSSGSISFPVAMLIIVFPLYILFMWLIEKGINDAGVRMIGVRKWLAYLTIFLSGGLVVGDLVTILYYFLDGQDITTGFLLKVLSIIVVAGAVFGYYITDARNKLTRKIKMSSAIVSAIIILIAIIIGFSVIGSPRTQRLMKYDQQKFSELQMLSGHIREYYQNSKILPKTLTELAQGVSYPIATIDQQSGMLYVYNVVDTKTFELCAKFNFDSDASISRNNYFYSENPLNMSVWSKYSAGEYCFTQTIPANPIQRPTN